MWQHQLWESSSNVTIEHNYGLGRLSQRHLYDPPLTLKFFSNEGLQSTWHHGLSTHLPIQPVYSRSAGQAIVQEGY